VAVLNWFVPKALIPALSTLEIVIDAGLGLGLLVWFYRQIVAWSSATLLWSFALTMSIAQGILVPLGYGVFAAIGAALLLGQSLHRLQRADHAERRVHGHSRRGDRR
jgi:hypothetical protein